MSRAARLKIPPSIIHLLSRLSNVLSLALIASSPCRKVSFVLYHVKWEDGTNLDAL